VVFSPFDLARATGCDADLDLPIGLVVSNMHLVRQPQHTQITVAWTCHSRRFERVNELLKLMLMLRGRLRLLLAVSHYSAVILVVHPSKAPSATFTCSTRAATQPLVLHPLASTVQQAPSINSSMDDDQESSFADLLARTSAPQQPASLYAQDDQDPWANPFASGGVEVSPYVTQLENDGVIEPEPEAHREVEEQRSYEVDPPSVIVQQEREDEEEQAMLAALRGPSQSRPTSIYQAEPSPSPSPSVAYQTDPFAAAPAPPVKAQPTDDLLGLDQYVDPSEALKKAFVKSAAKPVASGAPVSPQKKVVNRGKRGIVAGVPAKPKVVEPAPKPEEAPAKEEHKDVVAESKAVPGACRGPDVYLPCHRIWPGCRQPARIHLIRPQLGVEFPPHLSANHADRSSPPASAKSCRNAHTNTFTK
jgi:hypothetical protein